MIKNKITIREKRTKKKQARNRALWESWARMSFYKITKDSRCRHGSLPRGQLHSRQVARQRAISKLSPRSIDLQAQRADPFAVVLHFAYQFAEYALRSFIHRGPGAPFTKPWLFAAVFVAVAPHCVERIVATERIQTNDPHILAPGRPGLIIPPTYRASSCRTLTLYGSIVYREPRSFVNPRTD